MLVTGDLQRPLLNQWLTFAGRLPGGANVIDLGCGAATVGRALIGYREDLRIVGIDSALVPPQTHPGLQSVSPVRMEALPFQERSFDAAVSQFAVEYGDIRDTARELQRVLKPGGHYCFLAHHCDSEIACDGRMRRQALRALVSGPVRSSFLSGKPDRLRREVDKLLRMYPREQTIRLARDFFSRRISRSTGQRQQVALAMAELVSPEISMLSQLERSVLSAEHLGKWLVPLIAGMLEVAVSIVRSQSGKPIAWKISGRR